MLDLAILYFCDSGVGSMGWDCGLSWAERAR